jgi:hypothetical protein
MLELVVMKKHARIKARMSAVESRRRADAINTEHNAQVPEEENVGAELSEETTRQLNGMEEDVGLTDSMDDWGTGSEVSKSDYGSVMGASDGDDEEEEDEARRRDRSRGRSRSRMG